MIEAILPFNPILACDGYKTMHWAEMPEKVRNHYAVSVPRSKAPYADKIVVMGNAFVAYMLASWTIEQWMVDEAEIEINQQGYDFNRAGWEYIIKVHAGKLPLAFYGIEEGTIVDPQTPLNGLTATDEEVNWLVPYYEPFVQSATWKMSTVASLLRSMRVGLKEYCEMTGTDVAQVDFMVHNFGDRSADSPDEAAVIAGISHAAIFDGSDCIRANRYIKRLYNTAKPSTSSIEATEHNVMMQHSDAERRDDWGAACMAVERLYACVGRSKQGIGLPFMSVVIDTYDSRRFVREYLGTKLKNYILGSTGRMIARPDTGNPEEEPGLVGLDWKATFGCTVRYIEDRAYDVLHPQNGVIQGDGVRVQTWRGVVEGWIKTGFAMDNFCLGMGSGTTHDSARDDFNFSFKNIASYIDGRWRAELKDPKGKTSDGVSKKSLSGLVRCREDANGKIEVYDALHEHSEYSMWNSTPGWRLYSKDGHREFRQTWDDVKSRARS